MFQAASHQRSRFRVDTNVLALAGGPLNGSCTVATFSDVQFARIESLKRRIAAGTYRVPAAALADRLMAHMITVQ